MMTEKESSNDKNAEVRIDGHLARRLSWAPIRVVAIITGFALVRGVLALIGRFLLMLRRRVTATVSGGSLILDVKWSIMGKVFRETRTVSPIGSLEAARFENRKRYVHLLIGFGCLAIGVWVGVQYLVDGLRSGYPLLALVGAGIVAAGVIVDLALYLWVPEGDGRNRVVLVMGPWRIRVCGVVRKDGERFVESAREGWRNSSSHK